MFSYFKSPASNIRPEKTVTLQEIYDIIRTQFKTVTSNYRRYAKAETDIKQVKKYKASNFDYVTFHGTFTSRSDNALDALSGYFIADLDNLGDRVAEIFDALVSDKEYQPALVFISPSGDGIKALYKIPLSEIDLTSTKKRMGRPYNTLKTYFRKSFGGTISPDHSGSDLSRACFIPHDAGVYINLDAEEIKLIEDSTESAPSSGDKPAPFLPLSLNDIAGKYLKPEENHWANLASFIGAANAYNYKEPEVIDYINSSVKISPESQAFDQGERDQLVKNLFERYPAHSKEIMQLSPDEFAIGIFKYSKKTLKGPFLISGMYHVGVVSLLVKLGFYKMMLSNNNSFFVRKEGVIVSETNVEAMRDAIKAEIKGLGGLTFLHRSNERTESAVSLMETFLTNHKEIFVDKHLQLLPILENNQIRDTDLHTFFYFKNGIVCAPETWWCPYDPIKRENSGPGLQTYDQFKNVDFFIWKNKISLHDFNYVQDNEDCHFAKFLKNVSTSGKDQKPEQMQERYKGLRSLIGYELNKYFRQTKGQAGILNDEEITDGSPEGRTGKGVLVNALGMVRKVTKIDGRKWRSEGQFTNSQITLDTDIVWIDDVKPNFDITALFSDLTDGITVEKKGKDPFVIPKEDSPKFIITSNTAIGGRSKSEIARQFAYELSNYYSKNIVHGDEEPISDEHGGEFFGDSWDEEEYNEFFSFMVDCAILYLKDGIVVPPTINMEMNRLIKGTNSEFVNWAESKTFDFSPARNKIPALREAFINICGVPFENFTPTLFTKWLKKYGIFKGWKVTTGVNNGVSEIKFERFAGSFKNKKTESAENELIEENLGLPF
jgi:hypothetical protein